VGGITEDCVGGVGDGDAGKKKTDGLRGEKGTASSLQGKEKLASKPQTLQKLAAVQAYILWK
jgi:hypothetical protein